MSEFSQGFPMPLSYVVGGDVAKEFFIGWIVLVCLGTLLLLIAALSVCCSCCGSMARCCMINSGVLGILAGW